MYNQSFSFYFKKLLIILLLTGFTQCHEKSEQPFASADNGGLFLPDNFEAVVVVDSLPGRARHLAVSENGDVYVKNRYAANGKAITALRDTDGDGKADEMEMFGENLKERGYGTEMRIHNGYLYFSTEMVVGRYKLTPGDLMPKSDMEVVLTDDHAHGMHEHITKPIAFDNKGYMYVPYGAPSNACQEPKRTPGAPGQDPCPQLEDHGGIWRFDASKTNLTQADGEKFATGIRSVVAIDWSPDDNLYIVMHGRDDLLRLWANKFSPWQSAMLPSEEFLKVTEGADFGWPYCYYDQMQGKKVLAPEYGGDGNMIDRCADFELPVMGFPGHWAPNDLFFYQGDQFPERYKNGAFVAFHGSTNRAPYSQSGYFIAFVPFENGRPNGNFEVFADGFAGMDTIVNVSDAVYRPMGIAMGPDGSLYISETEKGKVWRIMYKGDNTNFGEVQLAAMENHKQMAHIKTPDEIEDNLEKGQKVAGEKVYYTYCAACHQGNGLGDSQRFPPLADSEWVTGDKNKLIEVVLKGLEGPIKVKGKDYNSLMPQHSFLTDEQVSEVLTYIRKNFGNQASAISAEEVKAMRVSIK